MFGALPALASVSRAVKVDPKDVPAPTPITLPHSHPRFQHQPQPPADTEPHLVNYIQSIYRPADVETAIFHALGIHVIPDASAADLLPDASYLPDFESWNQLTADEAREKNNSTKRPLNTGMQSPGCETYQDRRRELSIANDDAFRVVRRQPPPKGKQQARLGNAYEFYRCLENITTFWDDTSKPPSKLPKADGGEGQSTDKPKGEGDGQDDEKKNDQAEEEQGIIRTAAGTTMPGEYRQNLTHAFIKLVAYDFGCNTSPARTEPRLYVRAPLSPRVVAKAEAAAAKAAAEAQHGNAARDASIPQTQEQTPSIESFLPSPRSSYFASGCTFIYRSPRTRETARAGLVDGPVATVSARATTTFSEETDHAIDFAREIIAALLTAQYRAREGKTERRPGEGKWWTTKPRWGGGQGGPIGREVDRDAVQGDKDAKPGSGGDLSSSNATPGSAGPPPGPPSRPGLGIGGIAPPASKRPRKQMSIYDNYRMVRPPSASWDPKTRYEAIGKARGSGYDDIFIVSALFHHVSVLRVRVPDRLLEVLDGAGEAAASKTGGHSWGELEVKRSKWFDLFIADERIEGMKIIWGMLAWSMRKPEEAEDEAEKSAGGGKTEDVKMTGT